MPIGCVRLSWMRRVGRRALSLRRWAGLGGGSVSGLGVSRPKAPVIDDELVDRLMAEVDAEGLELLGPEGVLTELTSRILSRGLEVEMADQLGYEKGDPAGWGSGNNRNGSYPKTVQTDAGTVGVEMPRDRNATFEP